MKFRITAVLLLLLITIVGVAQAERRTRKAPAKALSCSSVTDIGKLRNVLFKNANVHGQRGRTFLDQGHRFGGKRTLPVINAKGTQVGCFGLYRCDFPFGCRYYQAMCGDPSGNGAFARKVKAGGGNTAYIVGPGNVCLSFPATAARYGSVKK
jgi:hypothetical protein